MGRASDARGRHGGGGGGGGLVARRAIVRWAVRMFRREWRQQLLMLALVTTAVTAAVAGASIVHGRAASSEWRFGEANTQIILSSDDPDLLAGRVAEAREWFGTVEVVGHTRVEIPGWADGLDVRALAEEGRFSGPTMDVIDGRYPSGPGEIALTDDVATILGTDLGDELEIGGRTWQLVGLAENPGDLDDEFALVSPENAEHAVPPGEVELLVETSSDRMLAWPPGDTRVGESVAQANPSDRAAAASLVLVVEAVVLLLVALVAAAGFVVVAQRRQRQIGLLAATGATDRQLRLVMLANGIVIGAVAASVGTVLGLAIWFAVAPAVEVSAGHRISRFDVPWPVIGAGALLGVLATAAAAWWPAHVVARLPVTAALAGRPPQPTRARRSAVPGVGLLAIGIACIVWSDPNWFLRDGVSRPSREVALMAGVVAIGLGVLFVCPLAVRLLSAVAVRLPLAPRVAIRDLARYRSRSSAALAAISLSLGIPIAIVVVAEATEEQAGEGNLSDRQMLVSITEPGEPKVDERSSTQLDRLEEGIDRIAASIGGTTVLPLTRPFDPAAEWGSLPEDQRWAVELGVRSGDVHRVVTTYVATPEVLRYLGIEPAELPPATQVLTTETEPVSFLTPSGIEAAEHVVRLATGEGGAPVTGGEPGETPPELVVPAYSRLPTTLVTEATVRERGWRTAPAGWLIDSGGSGGSGEELAGEQIAAAREQAAELGLVVEVRTDYSNPDLRTVSVGGGMLLALGIVGMAVGLIRSEATDDLRILAATGAGRRIRRSLAAATAGALALLGVVVGGFGTYLGLVAAYVRDPGPMGRVPVLELLVIVVGMPLLATATAWLLGGREPPSLVRPRAPLS